MTAPAGYSSFGPLTTQPMLPVDPNQPLDPNQPQPFGGVGGDVGGFGQPQAVNPQGQTQTQQFGPNSNLIGTQFNPWSSPDTEAARNQVSQQYGALNNMPNRQDLAMQQYQALANADTANTGKLLQQAGQESAAFGQLGSGMEASQIGDVFGQHEANLANIKSQLSAQTAGQMTQDQLNKLSAAQGVTGQLSGLDQTQYGNLTGERGYQEGVSQQAFNNALASAGLTQPNTAAQLGVAGNYAQQGQNQIAGAGSTLQTLFGLNPYQYGGGSGGGGTAVNSNYTG